MTSFVTRGRVVLPGRRLAESLSGRDNNLNLIRIIAAAAVLVSHAFPITLGEGADEPLARLTGMTLGGWAVAVFFGISGLLITRSFDRRSTLVQFVTARVLRLFPALFVVLVITVAVGALVTTLPPAAYFASRETLTYIPRNLSLVFLQFALPGVFENNPLPQTINGSLWTLFYEVVCYAGVVVVGLAGLLRSRILFSLAFAGLTLAYLFSLSWQPAGGIAFHADLLISLAWPFALGMMAYLWRTSIVLDIRLAIALWLVCFAAAYSPYLQPCVMVALLYSVAWLGFVPKRGLLLYNRLGDYSYGVYIFAFPIQQLCADVLGTAEPLSNIAAALPLTLLCAALSWHLVEERALAKVAPLADRISAMFSSGNKARLSEKLGE
ncbi:MAG: acyltransferase [Porphyrobacter sp.]|jgi:peptidoglycan/LPS O-acetylase OafA/YrhL|nr:acyltransferase [Porphyrobacter sp.]